MTEAAEAAGVVNMGQPHLPQFAGAAAGAGMVEAGEIGRLRHVEAAYRQSWLVTKAWGDASTEPQWLWRQSIAHGSTGVLGDVGIHILDFASFGAADDFVSVRPTGDVSQGRGGSASATMCSTPMTAWR